MGAILNGLALYGGRSVRRELLIFSDYMRPR